MGSSPFLLFELPLFSVLLFFFFEIPLFFRTLQHTKIYVPLPSFEILARGKHRKERFIGQIISLRSLLIYCTVLLPFLFLGSLRSLSPFLSLGRPDGEERGHNRRGKGDG
jgi:hypothetical protein